MKNVIIFIFLCFTFVAKGQQYNPFINVNVKKHHIKSVLMKLYENKIKPRNHKFYNYKSYYDTSGFLIKEVEYESDKDSSESTYAYIKRNAVYIQVEMNKKNIFKDSVVIVRKNDSIMEIKNYIKGSLLFYNQETYNKQKRLVKKVQISYSTLPRNIEPILRFQKHAENDTSVHTKIVYIDSSKAYVREFFNNNKNNYSEGYIYYNRDNLIEKKFIKDFFPHMETSLNSVELYFYDSNKNLIKIYRLLQEDFERLQKNPKVKISLIDSNEFKYNDKNMIIEQTSFAESTQISLPSYNNRSTVHKSMQKIIFTYGYEYW